MSEQMPDPSVQALVDAAEALAARLPAGIARLRVRSGEHSVDVEWQRSPAGAPVVAPAASGAGAGGPGDPAAVEEETGHAVTAPLVGTFYEAPEPGADPFVVEGAVVEAGQHLAIIEAMKIMNPITADVAGTVRRILVADGDMVEFGQRLMIIDAG